MIRGMGSIATLSQQKLITQAGFLFYFALILFLLLKFATHSILFIGPPSIGTLILYRSCASCFILTQLNYSLLPRRFVFRMAEASAKRVTGDELQGTMGRVQTCLLPAILCAHIFMKRETSGYEAGGNMFL